MPRNPAIPANKLQRRQLRNPDRQAAGFFFLCCFTLRNPWARNDRVRLTKSSKRRCPLRVTIGHDPVKSRCRLFQRPHGIYEYTP
jgi:hypothetical protein